MSDVQKLREQILAAAKKHRAEIDGNALLGVRFEVRACHSGGWDRKPNGKFHVTIGWQNDKFRYSGQKKDHDVEALGKRLADHIRDKEESEARSAEIRGQRALRESAEREIAEQCGFKFGNLNSIGDSSVSLSVGKIQINHSLSPEQLVAVLLFIRQALSPSVEKPQ